MLIKNILYYLALVLLASNILYTGELASTTKAFPPPTNLEQAKRYLDMVNNLFKDELYDRAAYIAKVILQTDIKDINSLSSKQDKNSWLITLEAAAFTVARCDFYTAKSQKDYLEAAEEFIKVENNAYKLDSPNYALEAAYWAGMSYQKAGFYEEAIKEYSRVGGIYLPPGIESDAARRMSDCLRLLSEGLPYPGDSTIAKKRERLLDQAIEELNRARLIHPAGEKRNELELDLIRLRLARRQEKDLLAVVADADAFLVAERNKTNLYYRAILYRAQARYRLGEFDQAIVDFTTVISDSQLDDSSKAEANVGLAMSLYEKSISADKKNKEEILKKAVLALESAFQKNNIDVMVNQRLICADILLELKQPFKALEVLQPVLQLINYPVKANYLAGLAYFSQFRLEESVKYFNKVISSKDISRDLKIESLKSAALVAEKQGDFATAITLNLHVINEIRNLQEFNKLLTTQFIVIKNRISLAKLILEENSKDTLTIDSKISSYKGGSKISHEEKRLRHLSRRLLKLFHHDTSYSNSYLLSLAAEVGYENIRSENENLYLSMALLKHLEKRQSSLFFSAKLEEVFSSASLTLALANAYELFTQKDWSKIESLNSDIKEIQSYFSFAEDNIRSLADDPLEPKATLKEGMLFVEEAYFFNNLASKLKTIKQDGLSESFYALARRKAEDAIKPLEKAALRGSGDNTIFWQALWGRAKSYELLGFYKQAADAYLWFVNDDSIALDLRIMSVKNWALMMEKLDDIESALVRLEPFADVDIGVALLTGDLFVKLLRYKEAYSYYLQVINDSPSKSSNYYRRSLLSLADIVFNHSSNLSGSIISKKEIIDLLNSLLTKKITTNETIQALSLLINQFLRSPASWQNAYDLAMSYANNKDNDILIQKAMRILVGKALRIRNSYDKALIELDASLELKASGEDERKYNAQALFEIAVIFSRQNKMDEAIRVFSDIFAGYSEQTAIAEKSRLAVAKLLLAGNSKYSSEEAMAKAKAILSSVKDQKQAEDLLNKYSSTK